MSVVPRLHSDRLKHRRTGANSEELKRKNATEDGRTVFARRAVFRFRSTSNKKAVIRSADACCADDFFIVVCEWRSSSGGDDSTVFQLTVDVKLFFF